jgi:predicted ATPase
MLKSLRIRDFHSCADVSLDDIGSALLLVGPNGAGKTTILQSLCWVRAVAIEGGLADAEAFFSNASVCVTFELQDELFRYEVSALSNGSSKLVDTSYRENLSKWSTHDWGPIFTRDQEQLTFYANAQIESYKIGIRASSFAFLLSTALDSSRAKTVKDVASYFHRVRYYPLDSIGGAPVFLAEEDFNEWQIDAKDTNAATSVLFKLIEMSQTDEATFKELVAILGPSRLDLVEDITVRSNVATDVTEVKTPKAVSFSVFFHMKHGGIAYYDELSFGTKRILQIVAAVLYDRSVAILLEQPEDGIHPGLLVRLMKVLLSYTDPAQLFITSHSPTVINTVGARDIWLVQAPEGKTLCNRLTEDEIRRADEYVDEVGQLADYVRLLEN